MTIAFHRHGIEHLSASTLNLWLNAPSLFVLEKLLKHRGYPSAGAHRGTATEAGVSLGLFDPSVELETCAATALARYDRLTALSSDPKRETERSVIPGMVAQGLVLREHGLPIRPNQGDQHKVEIAIEGIGVPIIGYLDWLYAGEILDLKTTLRVPSEMSETHLRQASIYKTAHMDKRVRFFYVAEKKAQKHTLTRDQYDRAIKQIVGAARSLERFLSVSADPHELAAIIPHNSETFYFNDPGTKSRAAEVFGY